MTSTVTDVTDVTATQPLAPGGASMSTRPAAPRPFLAVPDAAAYLGVGERFIRRLIAERRIPFHHIGRHVRLAPDDLDAFAAAGRVEPITRASVWRELHGVA